VLTPIQALRLKGHKCLEYDGTMTLKARESAIRDFKKSKDVMVLLISNVGTTGLNMTMASVVIFGVSSCCVGGLTLVRGLT
jgi:SNF2 family DNA or RNA helicase